LTGHGEHGWECVLLKEREWFYGRRFHTHREAMNQADELKARYPNVGGQIVEERGS
jgi:hypothetical protein